MWCQTSLVWIIIIIKYWQFYIIVVVTRLAKSCISINIIFNIVALCLHDTNAFI